MTPKPFELTQKYQQILQTPKIFIFLPPPPKKYSLKFKSLNPQNDPSLRMCENIRVHPLLGLDMFTCLQNIKGNFKIRSRATIQKLSRENNNSWPAYQIYWHTRSTQNIEPFRGKWRHSPNQAMIKVILFYLKLNFHCYKGGREAVYGDR